MADVLPYAGLTVGPAQSSSDDQFETGSTAYLFMGIQTDYFVTYEIGAVHLDNKRKDTANNQKSHLDMLSLCVQGHLPIGDSSLFIRAGVGGYQYVDTNEVLQDVFLPTYGAGLAWVLNPG